MQLVPPPPPEDLSGSDGVLTLLAPVVLERLDELVQQHVALVRSSIPAYGLESSVSETDLRTAGRRTIEQAIGLLSGTHIDPDAFEQTRALGRQRAQEGLPLEALLGAFRLGGRVIWEGFVTASRDGRVHVEQAAVVDSVAAVWEIVDRFSLELSAAYREHEATLKRQDIRARQAILDALVEGKGADAAFERAAAATLGLVPDGDAICIVARWDVRPHANDAPEEILRRLGMTSTWHVRAGTEFGIVAAGQHDMPVIVRALRSRPAVSIGLSPVFCPLREAAGAFRLATLALRTIPTGANDVRTLDERLPEALVAASPELLPSLAAQTIAAFDGLPENERQIYLATVRALLISMGSLKGAAEQLFCHRNTILHRLDKIRALTGTGIDTPRATLLWTLALIAEDQTPPAQRTPGR
jgi:hypothetical protein